MQALADDAGAVTLDRRQRGEELDRGAFGGAGEAEVGEHPRRLREEHRAQLRSVEAREIRAPAGVERPATPGAASGDDRHAGGRERVHVTQHGASRHLEPRGERVTREAPVHLQQQND